MASLCPSELLPVPLWLHVDQAYPKPSYKGPRPPACLCWWDRGSAWCRTVSDPSSSPLRSSLLIGSPLTCVCLLALALASALACLLSGDVRVPPSLLLQGPSVLALEVRLSNSSGASSQGTQSQVYRKWSPRPCGGSAPYGPRWCPHPCSSLLYC